MKLIFFCENILWCFTEIFFKKKTTLGVFYLIFCFHPNSYNTVYEHQ